MARGKTRLDRLLVARGLAPTRAQGRALIMAGEVLVDGHMVDKPGTAVPDEAVITLKEVMPYVGRGGYKLAGALDAFDVPVAGRICADVGACTGGFTDVLLQRGAARVYAIDVGYGQLAWKLRQDARVTVMERTNARHLMALEEPITLAVVDVSFISLRLILPAVVRWLDPEQPGDVIALIKPQFEAGRAQVGKGGIVKNTAVHREVLTGVLTWAPELGLWPQGVIRSPIEGAEGNVEFLAWLRRDGAEGLDVATAVAAALAG